MKQSNPISSACWAATATLAAMAATITDSAAMFPAGPAFDAIGYACTSGATVLGPGTVARLIRDGAKSATVTDPLSAVIELCGVLGVRRLGFVTPYLPEVSRAMRARLEEAGMTIAGFGSFEEPQESVVARIDPASALDAAINVARQAPCDAVFLSCTNLRTLEIIDRAETELALPVFGSNLALAWAMARAAGIAMAPTAPGRVGRMLD